MSLDILRVAEWERVAGLVHGFLGRRGGASSGAYASLNVSLNVGDDPEAVRKNRALVARVAEGLTLIGMRQVHGGEIVQVSSPTPEVGPADGTYTTVPGIGLAVTTADCVPILMMAREPRVAVAVHAGWRGTLAGVVAAAVTMVCKTVGLRCEDLSVALGPAIGACCYEVESSIGERLTRRFGCMPEAWCPDGSRGRLDLRAANRVVLLQMGVRGDKIATIGPCTACNPQRFFSHRRSGGLTGRQISFIGWQEDGA